MTTQRRRWLAALLGTGLLLLLVLLVSLDDLYTAVPPETIVLREVNLYEPPPPPPPPTARQSPSSAGPPLTLAKRENEIALAIMEIDAPLSAGQFGNFGAGGLGELGEGASFGLELVSLSDLDEFPMVLSAPATEYPKEAIDRGIDEFQVMFHVLIDEEGRSYPVRIVENPFPSLQREFEDFASRVIFSPPMRLGITVRTEYLWPVLFKRP